MKDVAVGLALLDLQQGGWHFDLVYGEGWTVRAPDGRMVLKGDGRPWPHIHQAVAAALAEEERR